MKRILMINSEYPPLGGGQGVANMNVLKCLQADPDLAVDLVSASDDKEKVVAFAPNINLFLLDIGKRGENMHFQSVKNLLLFAAKARKKARSLIRENKYDVVLAWSGIPSGFVAASLGLPFIVLLRGSDVPFYEKRWLHLDRFLFQWLSPLLWKRAKAVIANSQGLKELALQVAPRQKIDVLPNGVDTGFFSPGQKRFDSGKVTILGVGRLIERKNFHGVIEAVAMLNTSRKVEVVLVGDGPQKERLRELAATNNVRLTLAGKKTRAELRQIYRSADIFCLPSRNEGMSNALLEAIASGLPCVVSDTGGSSELVKNGENGFILADDSTDELTKTLAKLIDNDETRQKLGADSAAKAREMSWENTCKQLKAYL